ncbi:MAG: hypothetical protein JNM70_13330 [Anaerolineae bacterium]|nr:hypothetical protein [Anaerolineae bacterium]
MLYRTVRIALILALLIVLPSFALAQESAPQTAYYNAEARFGMPVPSGYENQTAGDLTHFSNGIGDIYVLQVNTTDLTAGIRAALERIDPAFVTDPAKSSTVNLANGTWQQAIFTPPGGAIISALAQVYDNRTFVLAYVHNQPDTDTLAVIVESADVQAGITDAIQRFIDPAFAAEPADSTTTANAQGTAIVENRYALEDGQALLAQGSVRGDFTYVVLERGPADGLQAVDDAFFTVLLGFFVTPNTSNYLLLGLAVSAIILLGFAVSLILRHRSLQRDLQTIEQLQRE